MYNSDNEVDLLGKMVCVEGEFKVKDKVVNEVFENVGMVFDFYKEYFKWYLIDNKNVDIISIVYFGEVYENVCKY